MQASEVQHEVDLPRQEVVKKSFEGSGFRAFKPYALGQSPL